MAILKANIPNSILKTLFLLNNLSKQQFYHFRNHIINVLMILMNILIGNNTLILTIILLTCYFSIIRFFFNTF